jgi:peptidoglycan glycosyltransferase
MRPHLIDKLRAPNGRTVDTISPKRLGRALTSGQAEQMRRMMKAVVDRGTGKTLKGSSVTGGKTGTADVEGAAYNDRWFIGFGPGDDPKYAVAVMTEAPGYGIESGPIAARILKALGD